MVHNIPVTNNYQGNELFTRQAYLDVPYSYNPGRAELCGLPEEYKYFQMIFMQEVLMN